jgi:hypothetical protein
MTAHLWDRLHDAKERLTSLECAAINTMIRKE